MNQKEKKEMVGIVGEALEGVILPRMQSMEDKVDSLDGKVERLSGDVQDLKDTTNRIENKLDVEIQRKDTFSKEISQVKKRVLNLETKS